jgi:phage tail-like protein
MSHQLVPFPAQTFLIVFRDSHGTETPLGGFTEVTSPPRKISGMHKLGDVTFKRGVVSANQLSNWINSVRSSPASGLRNIVLIQRDLAGMPAAQWLLTNTYPKRYQGPTLTASGSDVAIEELILSSEGIEWIPPK